MIRLMEFLRDATTAEEFAFLERDRRDLAKSVKDRGIDCILKCQLVVNGIRTVWCAQHDEVTLAPASARTYELASLSGSESSGVLKYLMSIDKPTPQVILAVKAGTAWFVSNDFRFIATGARNFVLAVGVRLAGSGVVQGSQCSDLGQRHLAVQASRPRHFLA